MTKLLLTACAVFLLAGPASAQTYFANVQLTIDSTAAGVGFTASDLAEGNGHPQVNSAACISNTSGGDFRYRVDGTAPTSAVGVLVPAGGAIVFSNPLSLAAFKAIRTAATNAVLSCTLSNAVVPPVYPVGASSSGGGGSVTQGTSPWIVAGGGTAGSAATGVVTVQGIASGTAVAVSAASGFAQDVTFGTATYTEATTTGPALYVRNDTPDALVNTTNEIGPAGTSALGGVWSALASDPCSYLAKTVIPINISTATTTELTASLAGASNHYYVCGIQLGPTSAAQNFALVDDDSDNCASVTSGMAGGTTAGSGWNFPANGGLSVGNGLGTVFKTNGTNRVICAVTSAAAQISGVITVVAAP